jgi:hypothetical protein
VTADERGRLAAQIDAARDELHEAQRVVALLDADDAATAAGPVAVARLVIERDLAARRVEAWVAVLDGLRGEGRRVGLFA